jgi:hypothetical protein
MKVLLEMSEPKQIKIYGCHVEVPDRIVCTFYGSYTVDFITLTKLAVSRYCEIPTFIICAIDYNCVRMIMDVKWREDIDSHEMLEKLVKLYLQQKAEVFSVYDSDETEYTVAVSLLYPGDKEPDLYFVKELTGLTED